MTTVGFVGFGEVASRFAPALQSNGAQLLAYDVLLDEPGGTDCLIRRACGVPVKFLPLADLIAQAQIVLSTVTTDVAIDAAKACARHLRSDQAFVDFNATSPQVKREIAKVIAPTSAAFIEGAILGAVNVMGARTRVLVCGEKFYWAADTLSSLGLNVGDYGGEIGKASTFKLLRSVFSKGVEALLIETLLAARRAGVVEDVWQEIINTLSERPFQEVGGNWMRTHGTAHARRYHEMVQVEVLLRDLGLEPLLSGATTAFFHRSTQLALGKKFDTTPTSPAEVVAAIDHLLEETNP